MLTKRPHHNRNSGKVKDSQTRGSAVRHGKYSNHAETTEQETNPVCQFPFIKTSEKYLVPQYYQVLESNDDIVTEDLGLLQMDLEKLLSSVAIRSRIFQTEIKLIERTEESREKRGRASEKQSGSGKRKRHDDKLISQKETLRKISQNHYNSKPSKSVHPSTSNIGQTLENVADVRKLSIPKVTLPKYDIANKFWMSIEPYCRPVTAEDENLIDQLIEEHREEPELKIPELGRHYTYDWSEIDLSFSEYKNLPPGKKLDVKKNVKTNGESLEMVKKAENSLQSDSVPGPLTQRLVLALMEENIPGNKVKHDRKNPRVPLPLTNAVCIERRLRKVLVEQGILEPDDLPKVESDDIVEEMKRVHAELLAVNKQNVDILTRLKEDVKLEIERQRVIRRLDEIDKEIINQYNKILTCKLKNEEPAPQDVTYAKKLVLKQIELCKEMEGVTPRIMRCFPYE